MKKIIFLAIVMVLSGCASYNLDTFGYIKRNEKTVRVPAGSFGLLGELKKVLKKRGWKKKVYGGAEITEKKSNKILKYESFNSKYSLYVKSNSYDVCFNFSDALYYDISLINNKTGSEVLTLSGNGCEYTIVEKFDGALNKITR